MDQSNFIFGQDVAWKFFASLPNTWDLNVAIADASRVAENKGTLTITAEPFLGHFGIGGMGKG
ncbi:MAG: hypothetical protein ACM3JQ_01560 [Candidatus Eiseniibacteriota bacterium]